MNKIKYYGVTLLCVVFLSGCSTSKNESVDSPADPSIEQVANGKVTYEVVSEYEKGTIGYESDEIEAKKSAIEKQAPDEYLDFTALLAILENYYPTEPYYLSKDDSTDEEKEEELSLIKTNIYQAEEHQKTLDGIEKTINNAEEYEEVRSRITLAKSFEHFLEKYDSEYTKKDAVADKVEQEEAKEVKTEKVVEKSNNVDSNDYIAELEDLIKSYDKVTAKLEAFTKNPKTYTIASFTAVQMEMNAILVELNGISDVFENENITEQESLELFQKVMESQTRMIMAAAELPSEFAE